MSVRKGDNKTNGMTKNESDAREQEAMAQIEADAMERLTRVFVGLTIFARPPALGKRTNVRRVERG